MNMPFPRLDNTDNRKIFIFLLLPLCLLLSDCGLNQKPFIATTAAPISTQSVTTTSTATSTATQTPTSTSTQTPSHTPSPTPTQTATSTPTPQYPVSINTPFPLPQSKISAQNAYKIELLASYGFPVVKYFEITQDGKLAFVATSEDVRIYEVGTYRLINKINIRLSLESKKISVTDDGSAFAIVSDDGAHLISQDGIDLLSMNGSQAVLSPNGRLLVIDDKIIDVSSGQIITSTKSLLASDYSYFDNYMDLPSGKNVAFSPDGQYMVPLHLNVV